MDLRPFHSLMILPVTEKEPVQLMKLSGLEATTAMLKSAMGMELEDEVCRLLIRLDLRIVESLPWYVQNHPAVMGNYIRLPVPEDVVELMHIACQKTGKGRFIQTIMDSSEDEKLALARLCSMIPRKQISSLLKNFLRSLPLFKTVQSTSTHPDYASVNQVSQAAPAHTLPVTVMERLLDVSSKEHRELGLLLGVTFLDVATIFKNSVIPQLNQSMLTPDDAEKLMLHVFGNIQNLMKEDPHLLATLSDVSFVRTTGGLAKPSSLFDPSVPLLRSLFIGEQVFPCGVYEQQENLVLLRKMGLRDASKITAKDILYSMAVCEDMTATEDGCLQKEKGLAILKYLDLNQQLLMEEVNGKLLLEWGMDLTWVPVLQTRPENFPNSLPWPAGPGVHRPGNVSSMTWMAVIGSVRPVIQSRVSTALEEVFGWQYPPDPSLLVQQLGKITECYISSEKPAYLPLITSIYAQLQQCCEDHELQEQLKTNKEWIWTGDGFDSADKVVAQRPFADLQPFISSLPREAQQWQELFIQCGVREVCDGEMLVGVLHQVKELYDDPVDHANVQRHLQLTADILNYITNIYDDLDGSVRTRLLMPVQTEDATTLQLFPVAECTYCDTEWIRQGFDLMVFDEQDGVRFVHQNVPTRTAEALGVPTLMSRMLNAEEFDITGFGQTEPLTGRLKRLLEDYTDGLSIPKELLQNADDAGATTVKLLYDERKNQEAMKFLIDENMKECQGPALWAYNDAVFTEKDFENITKLGGATKEEQIDKIGQFGLGFNAVYNITDVPSFISKENIVIFDPHMTHLGKGIRDKSKPGIRIDTTRNKTLLRRLPDQFKPFDDVFGCHVTAEGSAGFHGTLFRLPLRTKNQAMRSDISDQHYDRSQMLSLLQLIVQNAHTLLLFTQNVRSVEVYYLPNGHSPQDASLVFSTEKEVAKILKELPGSYISPVKPPGANKNAESSDADHEVRKVCGILKAAACYMQHQKSSHRGRTVVVQEIPRSSAVLKTKRTIRSKWFELFGNTGVESKTSSLHWLVSLSIGQEKSLMMARTMQKGLVPTAGIAMLLEAKDGGFLPHPLTELKLKGQVFCYMPLPQYSGLPVHINGTFALQSSRRGLSQMTEDDLQSRKYEWNCALQEDAMMHAYVQCLRDVTQVLPSLNQPIVLHKIWPLADETDPYFKPLVQSFYQTLPKLARVPILKRGDDLAVLDSTVFVNEELGTLKTGKLVTDTLEIFLEGRVAVVLPESMLKSFSLAGQDKMVKERSYDTERFYGEVFFPNIHQIDAEKRDQLVCYALKQNLPKLHGLLQTCPCIPASPDGSVLKSPSELVHPTALASRLFIASDGKFPHGDTFSDGQLLTALEDLGMHKNHVPWTFLVERAETMGEVFNESLEKGEEVLHRLLHHMDSNLLEQFRVHSEPEEGDELYDTMLYLRNLPFLQVMKKPRSFPLPWKGDEHQQRLLSPSELYLPIHRKQVSVTQHIVDDTGMNFRVKQFLGLTKSIPQVEQVLAQFSNALTIDPANLSSEEYEEYQTIMNSLYHSLQHMCKEDPQLGEQLPLIFGDKECIMVDRQLVRAKQIALNGPSDCAPHLYQVPAETRKKYGQLLSVLGVREDFEPRDYMVCLQKMEEKAQGQPLKEKQLTQALRLLEYLRRTMRTKGLKAKQVQDECGVLYVPNVRGILMNSTDLCFNDGPTAAPSSQVNHMTHAAIPSQLSTGLNIRTRKQESLSQHAKGIPFGQKESLTNSLKRVLQTYPCDHEILKELVQNADDAQATKIHFIKDARRHPTKQLFAESWAPLQGPALCVYNNRPFTEEDMEGIQKLGEGSKNQDPSKTGQYGIGFSSVYHLTDAPSLVTAGEGLPETLCIFDPHCHYVPDATRAEPGMRYDDVESLKVDFPDVFGCYLGDLFPLEDSTMFRFPLRNGAMSKMSDISNTEITLSKLQTMLCSLRDEAAEILLFTNYLQEISISEVDPDTGRLVNTFTVRALTSSHDQALRNRMADHVRDATCKLQDGTWDLTDISGESISCMLTIIDNRGNQEKWHVTQTLGVEDSTVIPTSVQKAFQAGDLLLLPRGGVARMLERKSLVKREDENKRGKVFCFLPLPLDSELPVSINGHFALGYENRRHLWTNSNDAGYKKDWNSFISEHVIAKAYTDLLLATRLSGLITEISDSVATVECTRTELDVALEDHQAEFPTFGQRKPEWDSLVKAVYTRISDKDIPVLPSVQQLTPGNEAQGILPMWQVLWLPPTGEGAEKAFFNDKKPRSDAPKEKSVSLLSKMKGWLKVSSKPVEKTEEQILQECLLSSGLKLLDASGDIAENFKRSGIAVNHMSPEGVLAFYRTYGADNPSCQIGDLPLRLDETPFRDEHNLMIVLQYCKADPDFHLKLEGLPLLLTADNMLRVFDSDCPVYYSSFQDLVPTRSEMFLKRSMMHSVFDTQKCEAAEVLCLRQFDIEALAEVLDCALSKDEFFGCGSVPWTRRVGSQPSRSWIPRLWAFIKEQVEKEKSGKIDNAEGEEVEVETMPDCERVRRAIAPLEEWCLIPACASGSWSLHSIASAQMVMSVPPTDSKMIRYRKILQKLNLPELDTVSINTDFQRSSDFVAMLTTTLDKPESVLDIVHQKSVEAAESKVLEPDECFQLLEYFSNHTEALKKYGANDINCVIEKLRSLPFYATIYGDLICLTKCIVYILPSKIPVHGIEVWQSKSGMVFLEHDDNLKALYDLLGCASVDIKYVYCQFIFQHFEYFEPEDRMRHLYHVYNEYLKDGARTHMDPADKSEFLETLRALPFIEDEDGCLQPASEFYDRENEVFNIMLSEDKFPPRPPAFFKESEWYTLMSQLGMRKEVSTDMYLSFTKQVAEEGRVFQSGAALTKSKVLAQHLFRMDALSRNDVFEEISSVPFIAPEPASPALASLYPQYGDVGNGKLHYTKYEGSISKEHEKIVWSQASLLPTWADPMCQDYLHQEEKVDIMERLGIQKEPSVPLVVSHLCNLCDNMQIPGLGDSVSPTMRSNIFKSVYKYLQEHGLDDQSVKERLGKIPCVLVENGCRLTYPYRTVVNMLQENEIPPHLYRMPMELGEFQPLFVYLGATNTATVTQYAAVLDSLAGAAKLNRLTPNELLTSFRAMKGLLQRAENKDCVEPLPHIYLPSTKGRLLDSSKLVYNDAPSYYDRVKDFGIQFLVDIKECGLRRSNIEEILQRLPQHVRPSLLSNLVRETLIEETQKNRTQSALAQRLNRRLKSELFLEAIIRLIRHEAFKSGRKMDEQAMFDFTDRLSTITLYSVKVVKTNLTFRGKPIYGSDVYKACYVEKIQGAVPHLHEWYVYINEDATLDQELLIPLAEKINSILGGILGDSVLYLLPILGCDDDQIQKKLDSLNVRMDHCQTRTRSPTLPAPGTEVPQDLQKLLEQSGGEITSGEYVAYIEQPGSACIYATVSEEVMGTSDKKVYLVNLGGGENSRDC